MRAEWIGWLKRAAVSSWLPALLLGTWESLARLKWINPLFFPAPSVILQTGWQMMLTGEWPSQAATTLHRMLTGSALGLFSGFACGVLMGTLPPVRKALEPLVSVLNSTPKLAVMPLLLLFVGVGETARLVPIALTAFVTLAMQTLDAVHDVEPGFVELARNYGAGRSALLRRVYFPACLPQVFTGLRLTAGRALVITISVELLGSPDGLGRMIWMAWQTFATEKLYIGIFSTAMLGVLFHNGLVRLEARLVPWGTKPRNR
ncbi:MAG: ABC transporter permease [Bryobacteraceae bacterium]